jgi:hypothetical protein
MLKREKLSGYMSQTEAEMVPKDCGIQCQPFIDSALLLTPIFGRHTMKSFPASAIRVWVKTVATSYIERFNCTLRQRVSRLVRKTLSFSKKLENHIGAIWYFVHYYNASLPV